MTLSLQLHNGDIIPLLEASYMTQFVIACETPAQFLNIWSTMTRENLQEVTILQDGTPIHKLTNIILTGTQAVYNSDNTITGHFYFYGAQTESVLSDEDAAYIQAAKIMLGEET